MMRLSSLEIDIVRRALELLSQANARELADPKNEDLADSVLAVMAAEQEIIAQLDARLARES